MGGLKEHFSDIVKRIKEKKLSGSIFTMAGLLLLILAASLLSDSFFTQENLVTILRQSSILFLLRLGLTLVVLTGNIDFSVGALSALCGCICAKILAAGLPTGLGMIASLFAGVCIGLINGCLVGILGIPSFVATYGMSMVASGFATIVMNGGVIYGLPERFTFLGVGRIGICPVPVLIALVLFFLVFFLLHKTVLGRKVYLLGLNRISARYSGINPRRTLFITYLLSGLFGAVGGILMTARLNAADAGMTEAYGLKIIAAVVVGGNSLLGGEGGVTETVLGALILTVIANVMNMMGVKTEWQGLVDGSIILLVAGLDILFQKIQSTH